ncbi:MAG: lipoate--protein ligase [Kiritimatiellales bacterium]
MMIVQTTETDVFRNLAAEEWLLENTADLSVLFLYVNAPCVVIGKNQNPWRECRLSLMEQEDVPFARRISGGGAVFHDAGNLNVSVIVPRAQYQEEKQYELILAALRKFGITAEKLNKNSLAIAGKKFSGNAFCMRKNRVLHHCTLLVNSDLSRLGRYLGAEVAGIETKAVPSIPSPVINLNSVAPRITIEKISAALIEKFKIEYCSGETLKQWNEENFPPAVIDRLSERYYTDEWRYCRTPKFTAHIAGELFQVEKGRVINHPAVPLFPEVLQTRRRVR